MISKPLVTIVAVCYNQDKWVKQTLDSIKQQTYPNIQLIVADDGSKDNSKAVIRDWIKENKPDTTFIDHPKNLGLTKNLNSSIPFVQGDYFQAFGCDDIMLPTKIEDQVALMENNKNVGIIYSDMYFMNVNGVQQQESYFQKHVYKRPESGNIYADLIDRFIISAPSILIRRNVLDELKGYNEGLDYEDHEFFLRAAKNHDFLYMPDKTVLYRITGESLSTKRNDFKFFKNSFIIYFQNFDKRKEYKPLFIKKLLFYTKNLYGLKFKYCFSYFLRAFIKTGDIAFLKFAVAGLRFLFTSNIK